MHSINKANFAILKWFKMDFRPRFTNVDSQLKHLYCSDDVANYADYFIKPVEQLDHQLMIEEWSNIKPIIVTFSQQRNYAKQNHQKIVYLQTKPYSQSNF